MVQRSRCGPEDTRAPAARPFVTGSPTGGEANSSGADQYAAISGTVRSDFSFFRSIGCPGIPMVRPGNRRASRQRCGSYGGILSCFSDPHRATVDRSSIPDPSRRDGSTSHIRHHRNERRDHYHVYRPIADKLSQ